MMREDKSENTQNERRESGVPGGGQGRQDQIGESGVYPVSGGQMPSGDDYLVRTPGEFGQRGRGLEGYYDHGEGGVIVNQSASATDNQAQETAASNMVDPDQDEQLPPEKY